MSYDFHLSAIVEEMFYRPKWYHWIISILLLPLSLSYGVGMWFRRRLATHKKYSVPIISIGNLVVGGSGKTPFVIAVAEHFSHKRVAIVSRGYGRESSGLVEVSRDGEVLCNARQSGDEPMLIALSSPHSSVIVSEHRAVAIELAISRGAEMIILDDGFNRVEIDKFEILLEPRVVPNALLLPSGPFREFRSSERYANLNLKEEEDYTRSVTYENLSSRMALVTAIANPIRLDRYLPEGIVDKVYMDNHTYFSQRDLENILLKNSAYSILITEKDWVKMREFKLPISLMKLKLQINEEVFSEIENYIKDYDER